MKGNQNNQPLRSQPDPSNVRSQAYPPKPFIISRATLNAKRPVFERRVALFVLFLSYVGTFLGVLGQAPASGSDAWHYAVWVLAPLSFTVVFQTFISYCQWTYSDSRKSWRYIVPTLLSVLLGFTGFLPLAIWLANWVSRGALGALASTAQQLIVALPLLVACYYLDVFPERVLSEQ